MSCAVITVSELASWPAGVSVAVGPTTIGAVAVEGPACGVAADVGRAGAAVMPCTFLGGLTSMVGSKVGDVGRCALACDNANDRIDTRKREATKRLRHRLAAATTENMAETSV
jgi:hypothetical protein